MKNWVTSINYIIIVFFCRQTAYLKTTIHRSTSSRCWERRNTSGTRWREITILECRCRKTMSWITTAVLVTKSQFITLFIWFFTQNCSSISVVFNSRSKSTSDVSGRFSQPSKSPVGKKTPDKNQNVVVLAPGKLQTLKSIVKVLKIKSSFHSYRNKCRVRRVQRGVVNSGKCAWKFQSFILEEC